jgi:hypothetical protein
MNWYQTFVLIGLSVPAIFGQTLNFAPYAYCPESVYGGNGVSQQSNTPPVRLTARNVTYDPLTGWQAIYNVRTYNYANLNSLQAISEVTLTQPVTSVLYSKSVAGDYRNLDLFNFDFIFPFEGPDLTSLQSCDQFCLPAVGLQFDYSPGGYLSGNPHTGCDMSADGPQYCFNPCPCAQPGAACLVNNVHGGRKGVYRRGMNRPSSSYSSSSPQSSPSSSRLRSSSVLFTNSSTAVSTPSSITRVSSPTPTVSVSVTTVTTTIPVTSIVTVTKSGSVTTFTTTVIETIVTTVPCPTTIPVSTPTTVKTTTVPVTTVITVTKSGTVTSLTTTIFETIVETVPCTECITPATTATSKAIVPITPTTVTLVITTVKSGTTVTETVETETVETETVETETVETETVATQIATQTVAPVSTTAKVTVPPAIVTSAPAVVTGSGSRAAQIAPVTLVAILLAVLLF